MSALLDVNVRIALLGVLFAQKLILYRYLLDLKVLNPRNLCPPCRDVIAWNHTSTSISVLTSSRQSLARVPWSLAPAGSSRTVSRARCRT